MIRISTLLAIAIVAGGSTFAAMAQNSTGFNYQGVLEESGVPVNDTCDFRFRLYDALAGWNLIGSTVTVTNVGVGGGLFSVELDFGAAAFDNSDRWLRIDVRCPAGNGSYVTLSPRQPITRSPYSIQTRGIFVDANQNVGIGTTSPATKLHVEGPILSGGPAADVGVRNPNNQTAGVGLNWADDVPRIRIGGEGAGVSNGFAIQTVGNRSLLRILNNGNVGIGDENPLGGKLTVVQTGSQPAINTGSDSFSTIYASNFHPTGTAVLADAESTGVHGIASGLNGRGVVGVSSHAAFGYGVVGTSNSTDGYDFYATGAGRDYGSSSSRRWKHNIVNIDDPLYKLAQLRGVYFDWDADHGGHHDVGMIAEEVGKVLSEIVNYEENGIDAIGMDYSKMTPLLVEAVNALRVEKDAQITSLEQENEELRERLDRLEAMMSELRD